MYLGSVEQKIECDAENTVIIYEVNENDCQSKSAQSVTGTFYLFYFYFLNTQNK